MTSLTASARDVRVGISFLVARGNRDAVTKILESMPQVESVESAPLPTNMPARCLTNRWSGIAYVKKANLGQISVLNNLMTNLEAKHPRIFENRGISGLRPV